MNKNLWLSLILVCMSGIQLVASAEKQEAQAEFFQACTDGDEDEVNRLLDLTEKIEVGDKEKKEKKVSLVDINALDKNGMSGFALACLNNKIDVVILLLRFRNKENELEVDVNSRDSNGMTSLMFAAQEGNAEIVELLLDF